jgi:hypothetical protein
MKRNTVFLITLAGLIFFSVSGVIVYYAFQMFSTTGQAAVETMNPKERGALELLTTINREMTKQQVYQTLGQPTQDLVLLAKWRYFGGSNLSEVRIYFFDGHPVTVRWIKLGVFVIERDL